MTTICMEQAAHKFFLVDAMDNIIGSTLIPNGDDLLTDRENKNIGNYVDVGDSSYEAKYV